MLSIAAENQVPMVDGGALPPLVALLKDGKDEAKTDVSAALGNLALAVENKVRIADAGAIPPLVELLKGGSVGARTSAAWTLAGRCC